METTSLFLTISFCISLFVGAVVLADAWWEAWLWRRKMERRFAKKGRY